ncbi:MAG: ABC transporter ATP-binding protein [Alphaproteobacteria bacterium]|nr:MAG: ABC transporter ATP-binding protein [Alphaproteobacteria bacterium]
MSIDSFRKIAADPHSQAVVRRVIAENWRIYRRNYALAILCMVTVAATTAYSAYIIRDIVNEVFDKKNIQMAWIVAGVILGLFALKGLAGFGQDVILNRIGNNIIARYQARAYAQMLRLGVGFYHETRSAYLVGQIGQNIAGIRNLLNQVITVVARDFLTLVGLVFVMVWQDPVMAAGSLVVLPIAGYVIARYVKKMKTLSRREVNLNARVNAAMVESAQGIAVLKAFTLEEQMAAKVGTLIGEAEKQANRIALVNARTRPLTETLGGIAIAGAVAFGGWRVIAHGADPGALLSFLAAAMLAYDPARRLAAFRVQFEKSLVNARMLFELLDTPPRQADRPGAPDIIVDSGEIVLEDVCFSYGGGEAVLDHVSFRARPNTTTALVGPSGGGKTTIINLIQRFHDLDSGRILVDGQDIADIAIASLRRRVSYVSQQPVLFEGTVADNIRYGRPEATQAEIEEAARLAQAHDFIMELPAGYDTEVGEMGANFSGGQRQRLSIARAVLRDAPILLLDEATSALDNESEKLVQQALDRLMKGRTTIVVAHRLSTIRNADRIIVIDRGRVVEEGSHATLVRKREGLYSRLYSIGAAEATLPEPEAANYG